MSYELILLIISKQKRVQVTKFVQCGWCAHTVIQMHVGGISECRNVAWWQAWKTHFLRGIGSVKKREMFGHGIFLEQGICHLLLLLKAAALLVCSWSALMPDSMTWLPDAHLGQVHPGCMCAGAAQADIRAASDLLSTYILIFFPFRMNC